MLNVDAHLHLDEDILPKGYLEYAVCCIRATKDEVENGYFLERFLDEADEDADLRFSVFVGIHPWDVLGAWHFIDNLFSQLKLYDEKILGIGEIGIDLSKRNVDLDTQIEIFDMQVSFAQERKFLLQIHCVRGWRIIWEILKRKDIRFVLHSFSASLYWAEKMLDLGAMFSFSPSVLKKIDKIKDVISYLPLDRILFETDYPFQCKDVSVLADMVDVVAKIKKMDICEVENAARRNFFSTFPKQYFIWRRKVE